MTPTPYASAEGRADLPLNYAAHLNQTRPYGSSVPYEFASLEEKVGGSCAWYSASDLEMQRRTKAGIILDYF